MTISIHAIPAPRGRLSDRIARARNAVATTPEWGPGTGLRIATIFGLMIWAAVICAVVVI